MNMTKPRMLSFTLRKAVSLGLIAALLAGFAAVNTVTSTNLGTESVKLSSETFSDDTDVNIIGKGVKIIEAAAAAAAGGSAPGVEVTSVLPAVNNALVLDNYAYEFEVKEVGNTSFQSAENLKIEVYGDDGSSTTLLATLYSQQGTVDDASVEGVTVTVDLGSSTAIHNSYNIVVSRQ